MSIVIDNTKIASAAQAASPQAAQEKSSFSSSLREGFTKVMGYVTPILQETLRAICQKKGSDLIGAIGLTAVTGLATASGVAPGLAAAAATFSLGSTAALLLFGGKTGEYSLVDRLKQAKDQTGLIKGEVRKTCEKLRNKALERAKDRAETQETRSELAVKALLNGLLARQTAPGRREVAQLLCEKADELFKQCNARIEEQLGSAARQTIPVGDAKAQTAAFHQHLCQLLSLDKIVEACKGVETNDGRKEALEKYSKKLSTQIENFTITRPSGVDKSGAFEGRINEIFGKVDLEPRATAALREVFNGSVDSDAIDFNKESHLEAYNALQSIRGAQVTLPADDNSVMAQVIRQASMPANRDIPHFDDLFAQLQEKFEDAKIKREGDKIVITGEGEKSITIQKNAHLSGGRVSVQFGEKHIGHMWNDKVEEMVGAFLQNKGKTYPTLEAEPPAVQRVIGSVVGSLSIAEQAFRDVKKRENIVDKSERLQIKIGTVWVCAFRQNSGDTRSWQLTAGSTGAVLAENIQVKDLKQALDRIVGVAKKVDEILGKNKRLIEDQTNDIAVEKIEEGKTVRIFTDSRKQLSFSVVGADQESQLAVQASKDELGDKILAELLKSRKSTTTS